MLDPELLGRDLDVGFLADEEGRTAAGPHARGDLQSRRRADVAPRTHDLAVADGVANVVQALLLRLLTVRGELASIGFPLYGSRHHELIGEPNTERNRALLKLYVLDCLRQEPRLERVLRLDVRQGAGRQHRDRVEIDARLKVREVATPLSLVVPFYFEGAPR